MARFALEYSDDAKRELRAHSQRVRAAIVAELKTLTLDPAPPNSSPMWGEWTGHRRIHVLGTLRAIYRVDYRARRIDLVTIGPRSIYER